MEHSINKYRIGVVVVLYNPDITQTSHALDILLPQVDKICIVDNSEHSIQHIFQHNKIEYIPLYRNVGIAKAQNTGIEYIKKQYCDYILFSDQDSIANSDTVKKLVDTYNTLKNNNIKIGGIGTRAINRLTGKPYTSKSKEYGTTIIKCKHDVERNITRCSYIRSSISLITSRDFEEVGLFDESLFIDGVDNEWCWRAAKQGYRFFIAEDAIINHKLGEGDHKVGNREIAISSPFRIYYQFRNYLWLCRRNYVPTWWKRKHLIKYTIKALYYPLFISPRMQYAKQIMRGIRDGLKETN